MVFPSVAMTRVSKLFMSGFMLLLVTGTLRVVASLQSWLRRRQLLLRFQPANASSWRYLAEGALNLVTAYCGSDKRLIGTVLRLRKKQVGSDGGLSACDEAYYFTESLRPRIRIGLLPQAEIVRMSRGFLHHIHRTCQPMRPNHRLQTEIDVDAEYGILLPNLSDLPSSVVQNKVQLLSCEIKPKSSILPDAARICSEHAIKSKIARFTMMQQTKLRSGKVESISSYNPLDLFSQDQERVKLAIRKLLQTPQNNFVLRSVDTTGISTDITTSPRLASVIARCFDVEESEAMNAFVGLLPVLLSDCKVLEEIQSLQALDRFDIENVYWMHRHVSSPLSFSSDEARQNAPGALPDVGKWEGAVHDFLIAQSAKDCSVIVTFALSTGPADSVVTEGNGLGPACRHVLDPRSGKLVIYRCGLVDLDAKQASKIVSYWEQDRRIVRDYLSAATA